MTDEMTPMPEWRMDEIRESALLLGDEIAAYEVMQIFEALEQARSERDRYLAALTAIDRMDPNDYRTGQSHLTPAFREVNLTDAWRFVCRTVNGVLHGCDENGRPLTTTNQGGT